ncbi:hypothetical protein AWM70_10875 [Paenibacillus yonginensis]|uniref:Uncharacterized protein n=1 Tax=Paenibacillus yonginensis TaxID=1462996 RepID=A0A1B1N0S8_9BACL|nr:hypothetical protein AWM70_10875 [Paenibacillus yonginensis]
MSSLSGGCGLQWFVHESPDYLVICGAQAGLDKRMNKRQLPNETVPFSDKLRGRGPGKEVKDNKNP